MEGWARAAWVGDSSVGGVGALCRTYQMYGERAASKALIPTCQVSSLEPMLKTKAFADHSKLAAGLQLSPKNGHVYE